jgi:bacteriorhodopsin
MDGLPYVSIYLLLQLRLILIVNSIWGIADGGRHLSVDGEIIAYAVLDILAKPVFGLWLLGTHARVPESNVHLGGFWAHGFTDEGRLRLGEEDGA